MASFALYRFYGDAGALLYVGITDNPDRRFGQHAKGKDWWLEVRGISIDWYQTRAAVEAAERRAVNVEQPIYNKALRRRAVALPPPPVVAVLPWERTDLDQSTRDRLEEFECVWTSRWWDAPSKVSDSTSRFQHDGRLYAWRPDDWDQAVRDLFAQEVPFELMHEARKLAFTRNGPETVWRDFFNMCALEEVH